MICKWLHKLSNEHGIWQELLRNKYIKAKTLSQVEEKRRRLTFLDEPDECKDTFFSLGIFGLKYGTQIRFWEDIWSGDQPLKAQCLIPNVVRTKQRLQMY